VTRPIALLVITVVLVWPIRALLVRARWTELAPRAAIVLWQSIGLAVGVALLGACFELVSFSSPGPGKLRHVSDFTSSLVATHASRAVGPNELFGLTAGLIIATLFLGSLVVRAVGQSRARARQRLLIDLVGTERAGIPGTLVVEHPRATVFSLPGLRPRVVLSSGAIDALSSDELAAVLAHERAHLRARHDLALLPFRSLASVLPRCRALAAVNENVATLIEMAADDRALRECAPSALARALCTLATAEMAPVALGTTQNGTTQNGTARRVERALAGRRGTRLLVCGSVCSALAVVALPLVALLAPLGGR
jgi:Zn-dependent protease with chaperone function